MKFLHTADWHLGQTFYEYNRYSEHEAFLQGLQKTLQQEAIDVLLVSGDIFDSINPSVEATKQLYRFLREVTQLLPELQIIITAGNHDSALRLEMPLPLLEDTSIHIVGHIRRKADKSIDYEALCIPLKNKEQQTEVWCLAVPFLRWGDYPKNTEEQLDYSQGIQAFYQEAAVAVNSLKTKEQAVIAMGHLHASGASIHADDTAERPIVGGLESIHPDQFPSLFTYVALGHIHKAQALSASGHIRYSGSPIPLSFSELNYKHQVVVFEIEAQQLQKIESLLIPYHTPLISLPQTFSPLDKVLQKLHSLPAKNEASSLPFLEVKVLLDHPIPDLKNKILEVLQDKHVRLARIDLRLAKTSAVEEVAYAKEIELYELEPLDILEKAFTEKYGTSLPEFYAPLLEEITRSLNTESEES